MIRLYFDAKDTYLFIIYLFIYSSEKRSPIIYQILAWIASVLASSLGAPLTIYRILVLCFVKLSASLWLLPSSVLCILWAPPAPSPTPSLTGSSKLSGPFLSPVNVHFNSECSYYFFLLKNMMHIHCKKLGNTNKQKNEINLSHHDFTTQR